MNLVKKISARRIIALSLATLIIFAVIFRTSVQFSELVPVITGAKIPYLALALLCGFIGIFLATMRWYLLLRAAEYRVSFSRIFSIIMAIWPLSILPGRIGDFARPYPLRKAVPVVVSFGTVILEKVIDIISLLLVSSVGFLYMGMPHISFLLTFGAIVITFFVLLADKAQRYLPEKIARATQGAFTALAIIKRHRVILVGSFLASLINWWMSVVMIFFLFLAFGVSVDVFIISAYLPLAIFIGLLPVSIAGMGTRDSALIFFLLPFAPAAEILLVGLGYSFIGYFLFAILGIPFLLREIRNS